MKELNCMNKSIERIHYIGQNFSVTNVLWNLLEYFIKFNTMNISYQRKIIMSKRKKTMANIFNMYNKQFAC